MEVFINPARELWPEIIKRPVQEFENIKKIVEAAGGKVSNIVKTTVFLSDMKNFGKMNRAYKKWFEENGATTFPARTTIEAAQLPLTVMLVEIEAIAAL